MNIYLVGVVFGMLPLIVYAIVMGLVAHTQDDPKSFRQRVIADDLH